MAGKKRTTKKTTRKAQPWMKTQAEVVRLIIKKEGGKDKCSWKDGIKKLKTYLKKNENIIIGGDFNIIPSAEDVHNPKNYENDALFRLEIRKRLREMINLGFHDAYRYKYPDKEGYTFWDYTSGAWQKNNGMRIDHFLVSNSIINLVKDVKINKFPRGREKPSDHTPIEIELT